MAFSTSEQPYGVSAKQHDHHGSLLNRLISTQLSRSQKVHDRKKATGREARHTCREHAALRGEQGRRGGKGAARTAA